MPFLYISNGLNEAQEDTSFVSQPGVEQSILLESGLARSIVSRVIRTLHFASCIVAGKKQCVNIIKKKITWSIFETVIILLACISVNIQCLIKRVFSTPAARSEFDRRICLTRDDGTKSGHKSMAQSIPSMHIPLRTFVRHLSFCFGKAANAPRRGLKIGCKWPTRDNTKIAFSSKYHIYRKSVIIWSFLAGSYNYCKKDHIDLINLNDRTIIKILIIPFLFSKMFRWVV